MGLAFAADWPRVQFGRQRGVRFVVTQGLQDRALTISSTTFLASPNTIIVFSM